MKKQMRNILLEKREQLLAKKQVLMNTNVPTGSEMLQMTRLRVLDGKLELLEELLKGALNEK